jgi:hypothetical protein
MLQLAGAALPDSSRPPGVVQLLDSFPVATDSGRHLCLVTEHLGDNLGSILYRCAALAWPAMACHGLPWPACEATTMSVCGM